MSKTTFLGIGFILFISIIGCNSDHNSDHNNLNTFCNPMNLSYRFCIDEPSRREAADPTVVVFQDKYFLFASKSGGYWYSDDLLDWIFIKTDEIPAEEYAPTAITLGDTLYFLASSTEKSTVYKSVDPLTGKWSIAKEQLKIPVWDPAFYLDDDNRLYLYWGCSNKTPLWGIEVDYNFNFIGDPVELKYANTKEHGWEVPGDYNTFINQAPWIEGAWVNKHQDKYYLQYSGPGTEYKSYSDGVYVADHPLGPYKVQGHNPFAYKPEGFAAGAGHGSTFNDKYGNLWHIGTITISQKHIFERRLGLYPSFYDKDGTLFSMTKFGDYPLTIPQKKISNFDEIFPKWMLLSYGKKIEVSSSIDSLPATNINNEDIRTYWAAASGDPGEYITLDLNHEYDVYSIQINFAEHNTNLFGRVENIYHKYLVEYSNDKSNWKKMVSKSMNITDNSHDYIQLDKPILCRYLRLTNIEVPDGHFAVSGFRVFGKGNGPLPQKNKILNAKRIVNNKRSVLITWAQSENAVGYNISYGIAEDKLYQNYMVYQDTSVIINTLNVNQKYYFTIESFNENGITKSERVVSVK